LRGGPETRLDSLPTAQRDSVLAAQGGNNNNNRRLTSGAGGGATDAYYKNLAKNNRKAANIHDIIKREINSKQISQQ